MERTFTFSNGVTVRLRKISQFMLTRLMVDNVDKYPIPTVVRKMGTRGEEKAVPNYSDPTYKMLVENQMNRDRSETLANISVFAVIDDVPEDLYDFYYEVAEASRQGEVKDNFVKSLWLLDMIDTEKELEDFQEAILGANHITERGLDESKEKFQDDN